MVIVERVRKEIQTVSSGPANAHNIHHIYISVIFDGLCTSKLTNTHLSFIHVSGDSINFHLVRIIHLEYDVRYRVHTHFNTQQ